jgi:hypothetical protein
MDEDFKILKSVELQRREDLKHFMGRAPEAYQDFKPAMKTKRPIPLIERTHEFSVCINQKEVDDWYVEYKKQRQIQWPLEWAKSQLELLDKECPL